MQEAVGVLGWLEMTALAREMRNSLWLYPIVEIFHILGFTLLVGAVTLFDLRLLGWARFLPVDGLARHLLPWSLASLVFIIPAGLMMFIAHPHDFLNNRVFLIKLSLIGFAGMNAAWFHTNTYRSVDSWNADVAAPLLARLHALASLAIWVAVVCCGRLLAYT